MEAQAAFVATRPEYAETAVVDDLRAREFARLDALGQVYLDYTGSGLYAASQVRRHAELLLGHVFGNPHSTSPASLESIGIDLVHRRVRALTSWLIDDLLSLRHSNGRPLVRLYGPHTTEARGGTLAFNLYDAAARVVDHQQVERTAGERGISLRTGCFCNPGAGEVALGLTKPEIEHCFPDGESRMTYEDLRRCVDPREAGAVRVSVGLVSSFADVWALREYCRGLLAA